LSDKSLQRFNETSNAGEIFGTRAPLIFMAAAKQNRIRMQRGFDEKRPCTFRTVKFVSANRNKIRIELLHTRKRLLAEPLDRIRVKQNPTLAADFPEFSNRLNR